MSWDYLFIQATNGAVIGIIYALIAVGVTLIFSILKIVNFAHGDLYMLGGYCAYYVIEYLGVPPLGAMVVSMFRGPRADAIARRLAAALPPAEELELAGERGSRRITVHRRPPGAG